MSARTRAAVLAILLASTAPALAQVASAPLGQTDPWGVGWLGRSDGALPTSLWSNTSAEALEPIYAELKPLLLSPAGRVALRRIALSSAKGPPDGAASLIPERLRVIEQLGETERSIDLRKRYPDTAWGKQADRLTSQYELAQGRAESACGRAANKRGDDKDWIAVRALCFALAGDFDAASLSAEHIESDETKSGVWLLAALATMEQTAKTRPDGRYSAPLEAAVSIAAKLSAPASAFANTPADVAAAIVQHPLATLDQKRGALRPALDGGRLKPADVLAVLTTKPETPILQPVNPRPQSARPDFLALALAATTNEKANAGAKATAYAVALKGAENASDFRLAAYALLEAIKALPKDETTAPNADSFARVAITTGDMKTAQDWRKAMDEKADPWAAARIDLMLSYAGAGGDKDAVLDRLLAALPPAPEASKSTTASKAATPAMRQMDLRRIENTRVLFLYAGTGRNLSPAHRALLAAQKSAGRGVSDAALTRITLAVDQKAEGEAALASIALLGPDVSAISFAGLADILTQIRRVGFEAEANALALEALQVWKAL